MSTPVEDMRDERDRLIVKLATARARIAELEKREAEQTAIIEEQASEIDDIRRASAAALVASHTLLRGTSMLMEQDLVQAKADCDGLAAELAQAAIELREAREALEVSQMLHKRDRKLLAAAYRRSTEGRFA
jgi:hypothetical protein